MTDKHGETPRTDAHLRERYGEHTLVYVKRRYEKMECASEFARQLERELTEVRRQKEFYERLSKYIEQCHQQALRDLEAARGERDGARSNAKILAHAYMTDNRPPENVVRDSLNYPTTPQAGEE